MGFWDEGCCGGGSEHQGSEASSEVVEEHARGVRKKRRGLCPFWQKWRLWSRRPVDHPLLHQGGRGEGVRELGSPSSEGSPNHHHTYGPSTSLHFSSALYTAHAHGKHTNSAVFHSPTSGVASTVVNRETRRAGKTPRHWQQDATSDWLFIGGRLHSSALLLKTCILHCTLHRDKGARLDPGRNGGGGKRRARIKVFIVEGRG